MKKACLAIPTNRECAAALDDLLAEAAHAASSRDAEIHLVLLDTSPPAAHAANRAAFAASPASPGVTRHHLDAAAQRRFLEAVIRRAGVPQPDRMLRLLLPSGFSYGAATNRLFLAAAALGCQSVHRRDSDVRYQDFEGDKAFPIEPELRYLGKRAADAALEVDGRDEPAWPADFPVCLAGSGYIGEWCIEVQDIHERDPRAFAEIVGLWTPAGTSAEERDAFLKEEFLELDVTPFRGDHDVLTLPSRRPFEMGNVSFHGLHEQIPLSPVPDTIGSDYFLITAATHLGLPSLHHSRKVMNCHTAERRSEAWFMAYHGRLCRFFLHMTHMHAVHDAMAADRAALVGPGAEIDAARLAEILLKEARRGEEENRDKLAVLARAYARLGPPYSAFARRLEAEGPAMARGVRDGLLDHAWLMRHWRALIRAAKREPGLGEGYKIEECGLKIED